MQNGFNQFQCPLCGRSVSIRKFDPTNFVDDVIGIRFVGLGYGLGFGVADKGSILDSGDPVLYLIADRVLEISRFFLDADIITKDMLVSHLPVLESRAQNEELEKLREAVDDYEEEMDGLLVQVNKVLSKVYEAEFSYLKDALGALIVEYREALEEEDEDEEEYDEVENVGSEYEEPVKPMTALDREIQLSERELQAGEEEDNI